MKETRLKRTYSPLNSNIKEHNRGLTMPNSPYPDYVRRCKRCDKLFHTPCKHGKVCDKCTNNPALTNWHRLSSSNKKKKSCTMCHNLFEGTKYEKYCSSCHKIVYGKSKIEEQEGIE